MKKSKSKWALLLLTIVFAVISIVGYSSILHIAKDAEAKGIMTLSANEMVSLYGGANNKRCEITSDPSACSALEPPCNYDYYDDCILYLSGWNCEKTGGSQNVCIGSGHCASVTVPWGGCWHIPPK